MANTPTSLSSSSPSSAPPPKPAVLSADEEMRAFVEALAKLPANAAPGMTVLGALKALLNSARVHAREVARTRNGRAAGEYYSDILDQVMRRLLDFAAVRSGARAGTPGIALLAMGSYGRRDLAPHSDIDLLILHNTEDPVAARERLEGLAGLFLRPLWDAGLTLGHAVRTPDECLAMMDDGNDEEGAIETATALLEARAITGDQALASLFLKHDLPKFFARRGRFFVEAKLQEALRRHRRQGESCYRTQPNLKDSPGGLRDFQLSLWIDRASQLSGHLPRLAKHPLVSPEAIEEARAGYERILTLRTVLHAACGRKQDVLDFSIQPAVATDLGFQPTEELRASELLLKDYFRAATSVYRLADTVIRRYQEEQAIASRDIERLRRRPVDESFTRIGELLYLSNPGALAGPDWIEKALRAFDHASRLGIDVAQEIRVAIRARLSEIDAATRHDPGAAKHFLTILQRPAHCARTLRAMRDTGLLGEYIPEFGGLQGLVINDVVHDFAVDEHTLFVMGFIDKLYASGESGDRRRREVLERLARPELLRLAALFHDLGKSKGGPGHSKRGALMIPAIAERLGLNEADARTLIFLVEQHLLLSRNSLRRDPGEGTLIAEMATQIATPERLDMLYLLTWADASAVGQGAYTNWKDELIAELYLRIRAQIEGAGNSAEAESLERRLVAAARDEDEQRRASEHCQRVPPRYLVEVNLDEAKLHLQILHKLLSEGREAVAAVTESAGLVEVWVACTDRPRRFSQICGALLGLSLNVVSSIAYTRSDGLILDHFRLSVPPEQAASTAAAGPQFWGRVKNEIEETLAGKAAFRQKIDAARRRIPLSPQISRRIEPEVRLDNKLSERYSVVDVACGDRIGLMYGLSRALSDLGLDIHFARVDTQQGLATAVFYVTELGGAKLTDLEKAHNMRLLLRAVADEFQAERR